MLIKTSHVGTLYRYALHYINISIFVAIGSGYPIFLELATLLLLFYY